MDYETLFNKKQYSEILDLTKNKIDAHSLSYRLNALIALSNYQEALKLIKTYNDILYKKDPLVLMRLHIELLLELKMFTEAINAHHEYYERPYISQQVEEYLKEVPNLIVKAQKSNDANELFKDEEHVKEIFIKSNDTALLTNAIYHLKKLDVTPYLSSLFNLLTRKEVSDDVKTLALLILIMKHVDYDVVINKNKKDIKINPAKVSAPYAQLEYKAIMNEIVKMSKDPTLESVATNLFNQYVLNVFPNELYNTHTHTMAVAFLALGKKYLRDDKSIEDIVKNNHEDLDNINILMNFYQGKIERK